PYAPAEVIGGTLDVEHKSGFGAELAFTYTSRQFTDELDTVAVDPTGQDGAIDPYVIVDVSARYKEKHSGLTASLAVKNLFGSTGLLAKQIEEGAPFDVFAAANVSFADDAVKSGACFGDSKTLYARGRLVMWTSAPPAPSSIAALAEPAIKKIAIANPEHAP